MWQAPGTLAMVTYPSVPAIISMTKFRLVAALSAPCLMVTAAFANMPAAQFDQALKAYDKAVYATTLKLVSPFATKDYDASLLEAKTNEAIDGGSAPAMFMRSADMAPQKSLAAMWRGYSLFLSRKYIPAQAQFNTAIQLDPKNAQAHAFLGCCLCYLDEVDRGLAEFKKAQSIDAKSNFFYELIGRGYVGAVDSKKAEPMFNKVVEQNPNSARVYIMRGDFLDEAGKFPAALADYNHAVQLSPSSAYAYYRRARLLVSKKMYAEAIPDAIKGSSVEHIDEFYKKSARLLSTSYAKLGQYQKAIDVLKPTLENTYHQSTLSGTDKLVYFELIEYYEKVHDYKNAKSAVDNVCRMDPKSSEAIAKRARISTELHMPQSAVQDYTLLLKMDSTNPQWYRERAKLYESLGKPESAKIDLKKAKEFDD
jgi:tetratricopeptide (TPR) repeat protein